MKTRFALTGGLTACLLLTGCYNDPDKTERRPGEGPEHIHAGPSVGPGTTAGGSTAGPQPAPVHHGGDVQPQPGGAHPSDSHAGSVSRPGVGIGAGADGHSQPATPVHGAQGETPRTGSAQTGNEHGPGRGPNPSGKAGDKGTPEH